MGECTVKDIIGGETSRKSSPLLSSVEWLVLFVLDDSPTRALDHSSSHQPNLDNARMNLYLEELYPNSAPDVSSTSINAPVETREVV